MMWLMIHLLKFNLFCLKYVPFLAPTGAQERLLELFRRSSTGGYKRHDFAPMCCDVVQFVVYV